MRATALPLASLLAGLTLAADGKEGSCLPALNYTATYTALGCHTDSSSGRTLGGTSFNLNPNSGKSCANYCGELGYAYAGTEYGRECYCGDEVNDSASAVGKESCDMECSGNNAENCGGTWFMNLFEISNPLSNGAKLPNFADCSRDPICSNDVCNEALPHKQRADALIAAMKIEEKLNNLANDSPGVPRLGLRPYNWWTEALHGLAQSPGTRFTSSGNYSVATSFPQPILISAAFDDDMVRRIGEIIGTEVRAFSNAGRTGLNVFSPNINAFKDPRWGRGQETPGEDILRLQNYVSAILDGFEDSSTGYKKFTATCKHYAANDFEDFFGVERYEFDAIITPQDLSEYYLPPFKTCAVEKNVSSFMCSYNAINGSPMCANSYFLEDILRKHWEWEADDHYVVTDCDCVPNLVTYHKVAENLGEAAAMALKAGTDMECNNAIGAEPLHDAWDQGLIEENEVDKALSRLFTGMVSVGLFDSNKSHPLRTISWDDVNTPEAQQLAYQAAVDGLVLVKNKEILPLASKKSKTSYALVGPWVEKTEEMQGIYSGPAPFLISPLMAAKDDGINFKYARGSKINDTDDSFEEALDIARDSDVIIYMGGVDHSLEAEAKDRVDIRWPKAQQELLDGLLKLRKPVVVVQFGGSQVDDTELLHSESVKALLWAGLPGQSGGKAILDVLFGRAAPAGRMPITQYPASYADKVPATSMDLRPGEGNSDLGRTYLWYKGPTPVPFGHGLHYTKFIAKLKKASIQGKSSISKLLEDKHTETWQELLKKKALSITVDVENVGKVESDYVALLFMKSNAGPTPHPLKTLVGYKRLRNIQPGRAKSAEITIDVERLVRADKDGNKYFYPGKYELFLDLDHKVSYSFQLHGEAKMVEKFPAQRN